MKITDKIADRLAKFLEKEDWTVFTYEPVICCKKAYCQGERYCTKCGKVLKREVVASDEDDYAIQTLKRALEYAFKK